MYWKELQAKYQQLQSEGKTAEDAAEMLRDEIAAFAKECVEQPEKMTDAMPDLGGVIQDNPILADLIFFLFFSTRSGWGW